MFAPFHKMVILLPVLGICSALSGQELRSAAELNAVIYGDKTNCATFRIEAVALESMSYRDASHCICVQDDTGAVRLYISSTNCNFNVQAGDRLDLSGVTSPVLSQSGAAHAHKARLLAHGTPPTPLRITGSEFFSRKHVNRLVRLTGLVRSAFTDEIDPRILIVELHADGETILIPLLADPSVRENVQGLTGARVAVTGTVSPRGVSARTHAGAMLEIRNVLSNFEILEPPPADLFAAPDVRTLDRLRPIDIAHLEWHTARGRVLCVWDGGHVLLRTEDGKSIRADLDDARPPQVGANVAVCGFPELNLFYLNLNRARWKPLDDSFAPPEAPIPVRTVDLLTDETGRKMIRPEFHGKAVTLRGVVTPLGPDVENGPGFVLNCDRQTVGVIFGDDGGCAVPPVGSTVDVTGICLVKSEPWTPSRHFPRLTGVDIILRTPADLSVVAQPPWWTPTRFLIALAVLAVLFALILVWNASLRLLVARRSRQLVREQAEKLGAELRIDERTRLAAELHDSVAQNLSSVSMQLDAVQMAAHNLAEPFRESLDLASKTLLSCRQELRNCLWDLRSQALDEPDLGNAVQKTLRPHLNGAALRIRFNVSRRLVSDQTAHAVLRILRELAANALRHGHARNLTVAGCLDGRLLKFSLADDGSGFDPAHAAGVEHGHFGLSGIHDRVNKMHGTFEISSEPGRGTKAVVTLNAQ